MQIHQEARERTTENSLDAHSWVETHFTRLTGRSPNAKEITDLIRIKEALNLRADDDLWLILYILRHYQTLYEEIPVRIEDLVQRIEKQADRVERVMALGPRGIVQPRSEPPRTILTPIQNEDKSGQSNDKKNLFGSRRKVDVIRLGLIVAATMIFFFIAFLGKYYGADDELGRIAEDWKTCFSGKGRIETRADGTTWCWPIQPDGRAIGWKIP